MLEKADSNNDAKISFEDFYSVMVKTNYWLNGDLLFDILLLFHMILRQNWVFTKIMFKVLMKSHL